MSYNGYVYKFYVDNNSAFSTPQAIENWDHATNLTLSLTENWRSVFEITHQQNSGSFQLLAQQGGSSWSQGDIDLITFDSNGQYLTSASYGNNAIHLKIIRTAVSGGQGSLATLTWTPSFVDQGNNIIKAFITGTPLSAFGTGFSAVDIGLIKDTNGVQTTVSTIVEFPDNTSVNSQYRTFTYTPGSTYFFANANVYGIYGPAFAGIGAVSTTTRKKVHSNFW